MFKSCYLGLALTGLLCACSSAPKSEPGILDKAANYVPSFVKPYKFEIQQGNFISQDEVSRLQAGMSKEQVRFILGTPLLTDAFHENRWDYVFRVLKPNGEVVQSRYSVVFENEQLTQFGGENIPASQYQSKKLDAAQQEIAPSAEKPSEEAPPAVP
ncbi:MAG: outer membrane protein assembly factor BamE [Limnobacter sp.]|nr:outer membrane protein assembly factor BamE [Limnobacter sp.]